MDAEAMDAAAAHSFAEEWQAAWNSRDLDRIMAHYAPEVIFRSRRAVALAGTGELRGREALRAYWAAALEKQPDLQFTLRRVYAGHDTLVIAYANQNGVEAAETLRFGPDGLAVEASACHAE